MRGIHCSSGSAGILFSKFFAGEADQAVPMEWPFCRSIFIAYLEW